MVLSFHFAVLLVHFYFELSTSEEEVWDGVRMCNSRGHSSSDLDVIMSFFSRIHYLPEAIRNIIVCLVL